MSECDDVNPNVRDICACTRAGMTLTQCNHRRALWGKPALTQLPGDQEPIKDDVKPLTTIEKITSFAAVTAHTVWRVVTLRPGLLTDEEMQPRLDICNACEWLTATKTCAKCGCSCNRENTNAWLLKIAHATSHCPVGKW